MNENFGPFSGGFDPGRALRRDPRKDPRGAERSVRYETRSGRILITGRPTLEPDQEYGASQNTMQAAVRRAVNYAEFAWDQPVYEYRAVGTPVSAYNLAVADYLGKPKVLGIEISNWTGGIGQTIFIRAKDNFQVISVRLRIRDGLAGQIIFEEGKAVQSEADSMLWTYTTTTPVTRKPGMLLEAFAYDLPGNIGSNSLVLS